MKPKFITVVAMLLSCACYAATASEGTGTKEDPIVLIEGENEIAAIGYEESPMWYTISIPTATKMTLVFDGYPTAQFIVGETASDIVWGDAGFSVKYRNLESEPITAYVYITSLYTECHATVTFTDANEPEPLGSEDNPVIISEGEPAYGPGASPSYPYNYTYYRYTAEKGGVLKFDFSNLGYVMGEVTIGEERFSLSSSIVVNAGDVLNLKLATQEDNSEKTFTFSIREFSEGETQESALALHEGSNTIAGIAYDGLPMWYYIPVPANHKMVITFGGYPSASLFVGETEYRVEYKDGVYKGSYTNETEEAETVYLKVVYLASECVANIEITDSNIPDPLGSEGNPIVITSGEAVNGPTASSGYPYNYMYYKYVAERKGVMYLDTDNLGRIADGSIQTASYSYNYSAKIEANEGEEFLIKLATSEDCTNKTFTLYNRDYAAGETQELANILVEGANTIAKLDYGSLPCWYKVEVAAGAELTIGFSGYPSGYYYIGETENSFVYTESGYSVSYKNESAEAVTVYVKINYLSEACAATVSIEGATTIQDVMMNDNTEVYDLNGIRTNTNKSGMYICNGKKLIVK